MLYRLSRIIIAMTKKVHEDDSKNKTSKKQV